MSEIRINRIEVNNRTVTYHFTYSDDLNTFFSGKEFCITYDKNVETVPYGVLVVPFLGSVLPICWLSNTKIFVDELDQDFYECLSLVKAGYKKMFPDAEFLGDVITDRITKYEGFGSGASAMFFSGGLDSYQTLISHMDEKPLLISIWGSDIKIDNNDGWNKLESIILETANKYQLETSFIRSSFREFDDEAALQKKYYSVLGDGWWHGAKHGLALLAHVAPLAYLYGIKTMYIASSHWPALGIQKCASSPYTDNYVQFCNCKVFHDGYEYSRQDKVRNLVEYCEKNAKRIDFHVCWETQTGTNCCHCEKCYRMMAGLVAEGADPKEYGFKYVLKDLMNMESIIKNYSDQAFINLRWAPIQEQMHNNIAKCKRVSNFVWYKWIIVADFGSNEKQISLLNKIIVRLLIVLIDSKEKGDPLYPLRVLHGYIHERITRK